MKRLRNLLRAYEKRVLRERVLILGCACVVVLIVGLLGTEPITKQADTEARKLRGLRNEINESRQRIGAMQHELVAGSLVELRDRIKALRGEATNLDGELGAAAERLVSPRQMVQVLETVLQQDSQLKLLSVENHAVVPLFSEQNNKSGDGENGSDIQDARPGANLYRHGFVLRLSGSFFPLLRYLQTLEDQSWPFFWDSLRYEVDSYPRATVELQVHTLSDDREWVGV